MKLGQRLKQLRNACGLTLYDAAIAAEISLRQLVAYENSRPGNNPRFQTLVRLAAAYQVTLTDLVREVTEA